MDKFYITAAIPYVNAKPHIGHAMEFIYVNTLARYQRLLGKEVISLSGGDENALKNVQAAEAAAIPLQQFIDKNTELFRKLADALNASFTIWQKSSDTKTHYRASQKLWKLCTDHNDIYKKSYKGMYCVGCEAFYTADELIHGECPEHPGKPLQEIEEENYFFKLSKYQQPILDLIESNQLQITPETRKNEVVQFIKQGLTDISISRSNNRAKNWGVPVPDDDTQRMYVWFDALNVYQSGVGFGWDDETYRKWWPADLHVIGKGIVRFHAIYWPAFLLSAKLAIPKRLFVHDYFTVNGQKMSKSLGNVYDPTALIEKIGADPLRYYCLAKISPFSDSDFSEEKLYAAYNSDLANSLGNTVQRIATLCSRSGFTYASDNPPGFRSQVKQYVEEYRFDFALNEIFATIKLLDKRIDEIKPWTLQGEPLKVFLTEAVAHLRQVGYELQPFLPEAAEKIINTFKGPEIQIPQPLFPRISM